MKFSEHRCPISLCQNSKEDIFKAITDVLVNDFECEQNKLKPDANLFEDLDLDSIDAVDLIVKLQKMTAKKINPEVFKKVSTLQDVVDAVYNILHPPQE